MDFEQLSNNLDISYPFRTPAPVVDVIDTGTDLRNLGALVADADIQTSLEDDAEWRLDRVNLVFDWPNPPTAGLVVLKTGGAREVSMSSAGDAEFGAWLYGRWMVTEWWVTRASGGFTDYDFVLRLLWSKDALDDLDGVQILPPELDEAWFEGSIVRQGPRRVRRAFYKAGDYYTALGSDLRLAGGFNLDLAVKKAGDEFGFRADIDEGTPVRPETVLRLQAIPGASEGRYLRCVDPGYLRTVSGVGPDDRGNVHLAPKDCYWLEKPVKIGPTPGGDQVDETATLHAHRVRLHNACEECCPCDAYVEAYTNLHELWQEALSTSGRIYAVLNRYKALRSEFLAKIGGGVPVIKANARSSRGFDFNIGAMVINGGNAIPAPSIMTLTFGFKTAPSDLTGQYVDKTGVFTAPTFREIPMDIDGSWPDYTLSARGVAVPTGSAILWRGVFTVLGSETKSRLGSVVTVKISLDIDGVSYGYDTATAELKKVEERG